MFHKGHGGPFTLNGVAVATIDGEVDETNRVAEVTNSGSGGFAEWIGTVTEGAFRCTAVFNSAALFNASGVVGGASISASGALGDSGKSISGTVVIEKVRHFWNNRQGAVEAEIAGKFTGTITRPS